MTEEVIRAKRFELVDDNDKIRALIDTGQKEHVALSFFGKDEQERATVGVMPDGFASFVLQDENGTEIIKATTGSGPSDSVIVIKDENEQSRIQAGVSKDGGTALSLTDKDGNVRVQISVDSEGIPTLTLNDQASGASATISVRTESTGLVIADGSDTGRIGLLVFSDDTASVAITDDQGKPRIILRADSDGNPSFVLLDGEGNSL